jgi:hypothetical protein
VINNRPPSFWREIWSLTRIFLAVTIVVIALMTAVFRVADAERHPIRAAIVLYTIVVAGVIAFVAWQQLFMEAARMAPAELGNRVRLTRPDRLQLVGGKRRRHLRYALPRAMDAELVRAGVTN